MRINNALIDGNGRQSAFVVDTSGNPLILTGIGLVNANAQHVALVDASGNQIGISSAPSVVEVSDGTNTANILKSDGTAAGQNAQIVAGGGMTTATLTLNAGSPATAWFDMLNYAWVSVEILTNTTPATLTFQTSGDASKTNITNTSLILANSTTVAATTQTTSTTNTYHGPRTGRYFRISSNVAGGNSATLVLTFYTVPSAMNAIGVVAAQAGTWTVGSNSPTGSAVPANAFYQGMNGSSGNLTGLNSGANTFTAGNLNQNLAVLPGLYNGSSTDGQRNNYNTTTGDTPTIVSATTTNGATQTNYNARGVIVTAILGTVTGVSPALALQLQWSPDGGTTWITYGAAGTPLAVATGNSVGLICYPTALPANLLGTTTTGDNPEINAPLPRTWRIAYVSSGTITSIAVSAVYVNYIL